MKKSVKLKKTSRLESKNAGFGQPGDKVIFISKSQGMQTFTIMQPGIIDLPTDTTWCSVNDKVKINL